MTRDNEIFPKILNSHPENLNPKLLDPSAFEKKNAYFWKIWPDQRKFFFLSKMTKNIQEKIFLYETNFFWRNTFWEQKKLAKNFLKPNVHFWKKGSKMLSLPHANLPIFNVKKNFFTMQNQDFFLISNLAVIYRLSGLKHLRGFLWNIFVNSSYWIFWWIREKRLKIFRRCSQRTSGQRFLGSHSVSEWQDISRIWSKFSQKNGILVIWLEILVVLFL